MFASNLSFCNKIARCSLVCMLVMIFAMSGCNYDTDGMVCGHRAVKTLLDSAECVMDDYPEYADSLMHLIDIHSIRNREQRARYALLFTATQYKTYQPFTSDTLIMEAVKYYSISKNIDYRFLSYYYLGCVYMEMGQTTDASVALAQAEQLVDRIDNDYWKGLLYSNLGSIYYKTCDFHHAEEYFFMSETCYSHAKKELHRLYALSDLCDCKVSMLAFKDADSILRIVEKEAIEYGDSSLYFDCVYKRLYYFVFSDETARAKKIIIDYNLNVDEQSVHPPYLEMMALYNSQIKDFKTSDFFLKQAWENSHSTVDSIYLFYICSLIAEDKGQIEESFEFFRKYTQLQSEDLKSLLNQPISIAQRDYFRTASELEAIKARNRVSLFIFSIIISLFIITSIILVNYNKRRKTQQEIRDYLQTIDDLTTQVSVNKGKIKTLNTQVREMLRQQYTPSDFLYTRYYEQIDDNRKAERLYRVVKSQIDGFTSRKNINRIDELLNSSFDGIMDKILSSGMELKEKDLLILRFVLAGFSAKSIATLLGETHQNVTQRKKRMLDKIGIIAPELLKELHTALNSR